jgi:hypothetical protein
MEANALTKVWALAPTQDIDLPLWVYRKVDIRVLK